MIKPEIQLYNDNLQLPEDQAICNTLLEIIHNQIPHAESKIRHSHPVWFINGNPILWYSNLKKGNCLLFRSGQSFDEDGLTAEWSFKAAEKRYSSLEQIHNEDIERRIQKAVTIQWDYKNIVKRKGALERLK